MSGDLLGTLVDVQTSINHTMGGYLSAFAKTRNWLDLLLVLPLGVAFGAVHALTPGHSKTVLASYLAGSPSKVLGGVAVAGILSLTHVFTAVLIALLSLPLLSTSLTSAGRAPLLEDVSRAMLALIGIWMIWRAWKQPAHTHAEGPVVGVMAGLIPCPLTLFVMVFAISRGVPEAGLVFALAMMLGVAFTLSSLAALTVIARDRMAGLLERHGPAISKGGRTFEALAGFILLAIGVRELFFR